MAIRKAKEVNTNPCEHCGVEGYLSPTSAVDCPFCLGSGQSPIQQEKPRDYAAEAAEANRLHTKLGHTYACTWCGVAPEEADELSDDANLVPEAITENPDSDIQNESMLHNDTNEKSDVTKELQVPKPTQELPRGAFHGPGGLFETHDKISHLLKQREHHEIDQSDLIDSIQALISHRVEEAERAVRYDELKRHQIQTWSLRGHKCAEYTAQRLNQLITELTQERGTK